jgi:hypothetical protein
MPVHCFVESFCYYQTTLLCTFVRRNSGQLEIPWKAVKNKCREGERMDDGNVSDGDTLGPGEEDTFEMPWCSVKCAARDGHQIPWLASVWQRLGQRVDWTVEACGINMVKPRWWQRLARASPLVRAQVRGRVLSQTREGLPEQLRRPASEVLSPNVPASNVMGMCR